MGSVRRFPFRVLVLGLLCCAGLICPSVARADWDPHSTAAAPCGTGLPPPGHELREFASPDRVKRLALGVKQDGDRLCYVSGDIAEAPVIRLRLGDVLAVTLTNDITDSAAIGAFLPESPLDEPHQPVPGRDGYIPIIAGMQHEATGVTNLHLHGFAVPPVPPEDEVLRTCADPAMPRVICRRRTISYVFRVPPNMPAGLYWYHPHVHGEAEAQVEMGLYGAIVVEGPEDDARRAMGIRDRVLVIGQTRLPGQAPPARVVDDQGEDDEGEGGPTVPTHDTAVQHAGPAPWPAQIDTEHELGCAPPQPDGMLVLNGTPVAEGEADDSRLAHFELPPAKKELWRIVNASADDFLDLALVDDDGTNLPITIVARDGAPLIDDSGARLTPSPTTEPQLVPPSGRLEFLVSPPPIGHKAHLVSHAVDTGCSGASNPERTLALVTADRTAWPPKPDPAPPPALAAAPNLFSGILARRSLRERTIALTEYPRPGTDDEVDYYITELKPGAEMRPFQMDGAPAITVRAGTTEEWVIENWTHELHAFHLHQVHFRLLAVNDQPMPDPPLVDVVNVPFATPNDSHAAGGSLLPGRVRIKITFPEELAGDILFHCHVMEHEDNGMMAIVRVLPGSVWWKSEQHAELSPEQVVANPPICSPGAK